MKKHIIENCKICKISPELHVGIGGFNYKYYYYCKKCGFKAKIIYDSIDISLNSKEEALKVWNEKNDERKINVL